MAMENGNRKLDYESLTQTNGKLTSRENKRSKRQRPVSPDSRDADTERSKSENNDIPDFEKEEESQESRQTQFSTQRRICLVGSLLLCVFTIFAFAFILPCHHKSCAKDKECGHKPLKHWSKNFTGMAPLVLRDFNDGKYIQDNLFIGYKFPGFHNTSFPVRHRQGVLSLKGCNGKSIWSSGIDGTLGKVQCVEDARKKNRVQKGSGCFVQEGQDKIIFFDLVNGNKKWQAKKLGNVRSFRTIPDIDGDHFRDILLLNSSRAGLSKRSDTLGRNTLHALSGKSGKLIGTSVLLSSFLRISAEHVFLRVHRVSASLHYILIGIKPESAKTGTLLAIEVQDLSNRIHNSSISRRHTPWGSNKPNEFGFMELFQDTLVLTPPLFADLNKDGVEDVVLCSLEKGITVRALDGKNAAEIWSRKLTVGERNSALPAIVSIGNRLIDIAVMIKLSNHSTRIVVLNGRNGSVRWLFTLTNPLPVPPVGVPKTDGIPEGLLLWLPKSKVHRYLKERYRKYHGNDETAEKTNNRDGPRRRRELSDVEGDDAVVDDLVHDLLEMMEEGDDGKSRDDVVDDVNVIDDDYDDDDAVNNHRKNDGGDDDDDDEDAVNINDVDSDTVINHGKNDGGDDKMLADDDDGDDNDKNDDGDDDKQAEDDDVKSESDNGDDDDIMVDGIGKGSNHHKDNKAKLIKPDNPIDHRPYSYVIQPKPTQRSDQTANSEQMTSIDYEALKKFLTNWENDLQPEQKLPHTTTPTTGLPTPRTRFESLNESPNFEEKQKIQSSSPLEISTVELKRTIEVNKTKREFFTGKQRGKSLMLACDKQAKDLSKELSVVLVYRDEKRRRLRMMEITEDEIINLGPHQYKKQFGKPPPTANCQHFIPNIRSQPLVKDIDGDGRLDLIYALEYRNSIAHTSANGYRTERFMKVKKLDILDAILTRKSKRVDYARDESKNSKRNERFESPFAQWKTD